MKETTEQYVERILSFSNGRDPIAVLTNTPARLRALVDSTPVERWTTRPAPDRWSAAVILAHLADSEIVGAWRLRSIIASDDVAIQAYDQDAWAAAFKYEEADVRQSLATFSTVRSSNLLLLRRVEDHRLDHHGMHAERGRESVRQLIRLYAGHDLNHLGQIERLVL
jgi:DinB superfamily